MYKYIDIKDVQPQPNYQIIFTYVNGEKRQFDMGPYLNRGIFKELKNPKMFNTVKPCFNSVSWANKADIDPETLYEDSIKID
ncbi:MAG: DUF2442 domain-containing protein [Niabella sp.]